MTTAARRALWTTACGVTAVLGVLPIPGAHVAATAQTARFVAVGPSRLADTRGAGLGFTRPTASTIRVGIAGRGGVPAQATAAVLTVTATASGGSGYVTVFPAGSSRPTTSTLNLNRSGATVANSTIIPLSAGAVDIYASVPMQLIVDVSGAFVPSGAASEGRLVVFPSGPTRSLDTRAGARPAAGSVLRVPRPPTVPATATAVVANVTVVDAAGSGFWAAWPAGRPQPDSSILNTDAPGQTRAALTVIPLSQAGLSVYGSSAAHVIVDIAGYFTGAGETSSTDGLFVPVAPTRTLDTRGSVAVAPGGTIEHRPTGATMAMAAVYNLTTTQSRAASFVTAYPAGQSRPNASNLNAASGADVANLAISAVSERGVAWYSSAGEHLIVDLTGYFTGRPVSAPLNPPPTTNPPTTNPPTTNPPTTNPPTTNPPTTNPPTSTGGTSGAALPAGCRESALARTNEVRASTGAAPVVAEAALAKYACNWSKHMAAVDDLVHSDLSITGLPFRSCGAAENIVVSSAPNATDLFELWVDSPGHYRNMIGAYTHAAVVFYTGPEGGTWGTMVLAARCPG